MKGLRKVLTPFAPDQSGAVSVLYELGGLIVVCDAGGCTGNICGFDEPRWTKRTSAIFSAGLRDMDAIMGRDRQLVEKLVKAVNALRPPFAAIVGTPVPACIGTDYQALARMAEKKTGIPVIALDTSGMKLADAGASKAYLQLMKKFSADAAAAEPAGKIIGVLGANPLELGSEKNVQKIETYLKENGADQVWFYGLHDLNYIRNASLAAENLVVSPSGLAAAKYLKETFGTPYRICNPAAHSVCEQAVTVCSDSNQKASDESTFCEYRRKVLIVSQFVTADTIRTKLQNKAGSQVLVQTATWFMLPKEMQQSGDAALTEEDEFAQLVRDGAFDLIIADPCLKALVPFYQGEWIDLPEFAISGKLV